MTAIEMPENIKKKLYAVAHVIDSDTEKKLGLRIPFDVYLQDPHVMKLDPRFGFDDDCYVKWEPGLTDGPTSARFVVVDYNADTQRVAAPARWEWKRLKFYKGRRVLDRKYKDNLQFHQLNVWAVLQRALNFYESGFALGRPIPWAFEGNRLIVVPHAGYGENAYYDRESKSLQFYFFESDGNTVYTCLSTDIINHEFGHAVLDGIRPYFLESVSLETAAFHEFIGDLTAILIILRNNHFRGQLVEITAGDISKADHLANIAEEFGNAVNDKDYLRTAKSQLNMDQISAEDSPHKVSQVLTGAMFDIIKEISQDYLKERHHTAKQAFWATIQRMQRMAVQPLDLLPPADVTFKDYALAVLRSEELSNPIDPYGYGKKMRDVFYRRGILDKEDIKKLVEPHYLYERLKTGIFHDIGHISRSRTAAYRFINDNRKELYIPPFQDFFIADLYDANKVAREARRLPRQIILEYLWREEVPLDGPEFGQFDEQITNMLCGGTLVFDEKGNVLSWFRKPGIQKTRSQFWKQEMEEGEKRRHKLLEDIKTRVALGRVGLVHDSESGVIGSRIPPITTRKVNRALRMELSPHLGVNEEADELDTGERRWQISF